MSANHLLHAITYGTPKPANRLDKVGAELAALKAEGLTASDPRVAEKIREYAQLLTCERLGARVSKAMGG